MAEAPGLQSSPGSHLPKTIVSRNAASSFRMPLTTNVVANSMLSTKRPWFLSSLYVACASSINRTCSRSAFFLALRIPGLLTILVGQCTETPVPFFQAFLFLLISFPFRLDSTRQHQVLGRFQLLPPSFSLHYCEDC